MLKYIVRKPIHWKTNIQKQPPSGVYKKVVLKIFSRFTENNCVGALSCRPETCSFVKKETPTQMFFWKFCEIFKITFL